jgi:hypothetical protein
VCVVARSKPFQHRESGGNGPTHGCRSEEDDRAERVLKLQRGEVLAEATADRDPAANAPTRQL